MSDRYRGLQPLIIYSKTFSSEKTTERKVEEFFFAARVRACREPLAERYSLLKTNLRNFLSSFRLEEKEKKKCSKYIETK